MENKKICNVCLIEKDVECFYLDRRDRNNLKPKNKCIECMKIYSKKYRNENLEKEKNRFKNWALLNTKKNNDTKHKWNSNNKDKVKVSKNKYETKRKKEDSFYKLKCNLKTMINNSFRKRNLQKNKKTIDIIGCSYEDFRKYIESKFKTWMNWGNKGLYNGKENYGWDIDHIIPISSAKNEEDVIKLNHYTNLQPLCSKINRDIKKQKII